jgi:hypothetical protein
MMMLDTHNHRVWVVGVRGIATRCSGIFFHTGYLFCHFRTRVFPLYWDTGDNWEKRRGTEIYGMHRSELGRAAF